MKQYLAISLLAEEQPQLLLNIAAIISQTHCTFETTRMVTLGARACYAFLAAGTWDGLHKLETQQRQYCQSHKIAMSFARTNKPAPKAQKLLCYTLELMTHEKAGVLHDIARFLHTEKIETDEIFASTFHSRTGTLMSQLVMRVLIPADLSLTDLRERFMTLCEQLNVDAALEPERI